jgi:hypothetical protein
MVNTRRRTLLVTAGVAVAALFVGLGAGQFIRSPADAASRAETPDASAITVPVESRVLESKISTRGDAAFAGATEIELSLGDLASPAVVTGQVPQRGDELEEGEPLLEVIGRPILALAGELPMYRTLRPGMSGPDVKQLKQTLRRLGLDPGADDDQYTVVTGQAVAALFQRAGYPAPEPDEDVAAEVAAAQDAVDAAQDALTAAEQALTAAGSGPTESERVAAQNRVDAAKRALETAEQDGDKNAIADARAELKQAEADQRELLAGPDTSDQRAARDSARSELDSAQAALSEAQGKAGTPLPVSEVYYLESLPQRVDDVSVSRGDLADGPVITVSGAGLQITARLSDSDRAQVTEDQPVLLDLPWGEGTGTITGFTESDDRPVALIVVDDLTAEEEDQLRGENIRVTVPLSSTDGEVLAVPLAALTAGPSGASRVEVQRDGETDLVEVEVGLVADGYAEVRAVDGSLGAGDLVVVGRSGADEPEEQQ